MMVAANVTFAELASEPGRYRGETHPTALGGLDIPACYGEVLAVIRAADRPLARRDIAALLPHIKLGTLSDALECARDMGEAHRVKAKYAPGPGEAR